MLQMQNIICMSRAVGTSQWQTAGLAGGSVWAPSRTHKNVQAKTTTAKSQMDVSSSSCS